MPKDFWVCGVKLASFDARGGLTFRFLLYFFVDEGQSFNVESLLSFVAGLFCPVSV
jgi:hypothetical protein